MKHALLIALLLIALPSAYAITPQSTAFTYQGKLSTNGNAASGNFDLTFKLFDAATGGNQVGSTINMSQFPVVNGAFTTDLDFPGQFLGYQLWVEVAVGGQTLSPRQPVNSVPVAEFALSGNSGPAGPTGPRGYASLINLTPELPGNNCIIGGTKIAAGADANGNGILDLSEVTATSYLCNLTSAPTLPSQCFGAINWAFRTIDFTVIDPDSSAPSPNIDPNGLIKPNTGALVTLAAHPLDANTCGTLAITPYSYAWSIFSAPAGSQAALSSITDANPVFIPDVPGTYVFETRVKDALGNQTAPRQLFLNTSSCGANPVNEQIVYVPGLFPDRPGSLQAFASSADNDSTQCPQRFATSFVYAWSLRSAPLPLPNMQFSSPTLAGTDFLTSAVGFYSIGVTVRGSNGQSRSMSIDLIFQPLATATAVGSDLSPSTLGQSVTFSATVVPQDGNWGPPLGTIIFQDGATTIGGCSARLLNSGVATCTTASLPTGSHTITATYVTSSGNYNGSAGMLTQSVN